MNHPTHPLWRAGVVLGCLLAAACTDQGQESLLAPAAAVRSEAAEREAERAALDHVTRAVALALQDQGLRQQVKQDMRESRFTAEHKLEFRGYLAGPRGGILLAKMAKQTGRSREELLALVHAVRPLEFYMPKAEHRETWTGGDDLYVASLLEEDTPPTAFTLSGQPVALDPEVLGPVPVLGIVPVETRFDRTMDARWTNRNDRGGQAIGTLAPGRRSGSGSGSVLSVEPSPFCTDAGCTIPPTMCETDPSLPECQYTPTHPAGQYMVSNELYDDHEDGLKGEPEMEIMIFGYTPESRAYSEANKLSCAGEDPLNQGYQAHAGLRYFNQDAHSLSGAAVLLFTKEEVEAYNARFPQDPYTIMMWEDDDTKCAVKDDNNIAEAALRTLISLYRWNSVRLEKVNAPAGCDFRCVVQLGKNIGEILVKSASWLHTNDDLVGVASLEPGSETRFRLRDKDSDNGFVTIVTSDAF